MKHKIYWEQQKRTCLKTSNESHLDWKIIFQKNLLNFRVFIVFEADNEIDGSSIGNETTTIFNQNPVCNGFCIVSELDKNLNCRYCESNLGRIM